MCARRGLRESGEEFLLFVCGHTTAGVFDLQPEECYFAFAPFGFVGDVCLGLLIVGECNLVPALRWTGPGATDSDGDGFLRAVFGEFNGVGASSVSDGDATGG